MLLAFGQLDDPAMLGVLLRSVVFACLSFAGLAALGLWASHALLPSWWTHWLGDLATLAITGVLALWLFVPVAIVIATCFLDAIASAVDRRFYPGLPLPRGAPILAQLWDGLALGARVLALNLIGLILAILLPGVGALLAWAIAAWALGRGLFVARRDAPARTDRGARRLSRPAWRRAAPGCRAGAARLGAGRQPAGPDPGGRGDGARAAGAAGATARLIRTRKDSPRLLLRATPSC